MTRSVCYFPTSADVTLVLLHYRTNSIYLYNLTESGFLNSLSTLEVSGIPLSITFDVCNQLWVLCPRAVHCYLINGSKVNDTCLYCFAFVRHLWLKIVVVQCKDSYSVYIVYMWVYPTRKRGFCLM